jgi:NADH dehydrogenase
VVEAIDKPELNGRIVELGGPEVVTYEAMFDWFIQARGIKKAKLKLPTLLLIPGAMAMEAMLADPIATPDEINTIQLDNVADGIDSVSAHFGWRPTRPSSWAQEHWKKTRAR